MVLLHLDFVKPEVEAEEEEAVFHPLASPCSPTGLAGQSTSPARQSQSGRPQTQWIAIMSEKKQIFLWETTIFCVSSCYLQFKFPRVLLLL